MTRYGVGVPLVFLASGLLALNGAGGSAAPPPDPSVEQLQQKLVAFAGGPGALAKVRTLSFDFVVDTGKGARLVFHHAYDKRKGLYRYECSVADFAKVPVWDETAGDRWQPAADPPRGERLVAVYHFPRVDGTVYVDGNRLPEPDNARILRRVHSRVMNERAWMFLPSFMGSPRLNTRTVTPVSDPEHGRLEGFEGYWGEKPGDSDVYTCYLAADGQLVRTDFRLKQSLDKSTTVLWREWKWFGPVRIAGERYLPQSGRRLIFDNLKVNEPVSVQAPG
jgi:hypothetical protein